MHSVYKADFTSNLIGLQFLVLHANSACGSFRTVHLQTEEVMDGAYLWRNVFPTVVYSAFGKPKSIPTYEILPEMLIEFDRMCYFSIWLHATRPMISQFDRSFLFSLSSSPLSVYHLLPLLSMTNLSNRGKRVSHQIPSPRPCTSVIRPLKCPTFISQLHEVNIMI